MQATFANTQWIRPVIHWPRDYLIDGCVGWGRMMAYPQRLGIVALLILLSMGCGPSGPRTNAQPGVSVQPGSDPPSRTLVMAARVEMPGLSSKAIRSSGLTSGTVTRLFNAGLALVDDRGAARPYLAQALPELNTDTWRVFPDGRMETTYRLKPDLTWHDGAALAAEDFVFAWRVYAHPESGAGSSPPLDQMDEVIAADPRTLVIRWRQPYADAGALGWGGGGSGGPSLPPLPRHILEQSFRQNPENLDTFLAQPYWGLEYIGLGPYRLDRWETGAFLEAVPFDGHVLGRARIPRIRVIFLPDPNTVVANMLANEAHITVDDSIRFQQGMILRQQWASRDRGGLVLVYPALWRWTQVQQRPEMAMPRTLMDLRVRRALAHSLDRDALNEALFEGEGLMAETPVQPTVDYYAQVERALVKHPYDPRRTEQLLVEVGYAKGADGVITHPTEGRFAMELNVLASAQNEAELSIIADGWRRVGIDVKQVIWSPTQGADPQVRATFPGLSTTSGSGGVDELSKYQSSNTPTAERRWRGSNRGAWPVPAEFDRLADAFNGTLNRGERVGHAVNMARIFTDQLAVIGLYFNPTVTAFAPGLTGPRTPAPDSSLAWNVHEWEFK